MKKNIILILVAVVLASLWWRNSKSPTQPELPIIGLIQAIEHPALDQTRKGIFDELQAQGDRKSVV